MSDIVRPIFVPPEGAPKVAQAIVGVMREVEEVPKSGTNKEHKYRFVEATVLMAHVQDAMVKHKLVLSPREISRAVIGGILIMKYEFDACCEEQAVINIGSYSAACRFQFRAGSYDDKATAKALTSALKQYSIALFKIPSDVADIERDRDDFEPPKRPPPTEPFAPRHDDPRDDLPPEAMAPQADEPPDEPLDGDLRAFRHRLRAAVNRSDADRLWRANAVLLNGCSDQIYNLLRDDYQDRWDVAPPEPQGA